MLNNTREFRIETIDLSVVIWNISNLLVQILVSSLEKLDLIHKYCVQGLQIEIGSTASARVALPGSPSVQDCQTTQIIQGPDAHSL
ncbi:hypothetical protein J6590_086985 [Homalodisca vitripennis]|nr:hypothetical protein J6590_086985 [Homalodisca vitripennis]